MRRITLCIFCVLATTANAQYGFMDGFMRGMDNFMSGMGNFQATMQSNMQHMGQQIREANQRQAAILEPYTRSLRPGEGRQINDGNLRGYVYKNMDGGISYSMSSGSPGASGYMFHNGPGGTFERRW